MKKTLSILAVFLLAATSGLYGQQAAAEPVPSQPSVELLRDLPEQATFVGYVDLQKLLQSAAIASLIDDHVFDQLADGLGLNLRRDIQNVTFFATMKDGKLDQGAAVLRGRFDRARLLSILQSQLFKPQSHNGTEIYVSPESSGDLRAVALFDGQVAAVGDLGGVQAVVDARRLGNAGAGVNAALVGMIGYVRPQDSFWVAGSLESILPAALGAVSPLAKLPLPPLRSVLVSGNIQENLSAAIRAWTTDLAAARDLENLLRGLLLLGRLQGSGNPELKQLLEGIEVASDGDTVVLNVNLPFSVLMNLGVQLADTGKMIK